MGLSRRRVLALAGAALAAPSAARRGWAQAYPSRTVRVIVPVAAGGATVGQLEEEELFYLASRGMHKDLARNLLTYGFAEEVIDKIKIESIKAQLDKAVLNRLQARLEV